MTRSTLTRAATFSVAVLLFAAPAACSKTTGDPATTTTTAGTTPATAAPATSRPPGTGTTSTTRAAGTSTTRPPATTTSSVPPTSSGPTSSTTPAALPTTPEGFAAALVAAWHANSEDMARQVADQFAIDSLFAVPYAEPVTFVECSGAAGSTICKYTAPSVTILIQVRNLTGGLPMTVTSVRVSGAGG